MELLGAFQLVPGGDICPFQVSMQQHFVSSHLYTRVRRDDVFFFLGGGGSLPKDSMTGPGLEP